jgi:rfaE bifunctional protein kinase chain/domain
MIKEAKSSGKTVLVDPKGFDYERYAGVDVITPNRSELAKVMGPWSSEAELEVKAQHLRERLQIGALLLTRSEEGMSLFDAEGHLRVHAQAREVFDVTGAGDTVIAVAALCPFSGEGFLQLVVVCACQRQASRNRQHGLSPCR